MPTGSVFILKIIMRLWIMVKYEDRRFEDTLPKMLTHVNNSFSS